MTLQIDSREKKKAIQKIIATFDDAGIQYFISKLPVGDYANLDKPRVVIDRKQNLLELCSNVCQGHKRFCAELERAQKYGIKLIILCEHGGDIKNLSDVLAWKNPRLKESPMAMSGERLYNVLSRLGHKYGIEYCFCEKGQTGKRIIELLKE